MSTTSVPRVSRSGKGKIIKPHDICLILAEIDLDIEAAGKLALELDVAKKFGPASRHLMDEQSVCLTGAALHLRSLIREEILGSQLGVYCAIESFQHDQEVAALFANLKGSVKQIFEREVSPSKALRQMPVTTAYWPALAVQAEGPTRIFNQSSFAEEQALQQAQLDLNDGSCEFALFLSFDSLKARVRGKLCRKH